MKSTPWLAYAITTTIFWGAWGALIEIPEKRGFPETLSYCVWAFTMLIPTFFALKNIKWKIEKNRKSILQGVLIGLLGALGQLVLFKALSLGPAYLIFPFISLSPVVTILFSFIFLKERTSLKTWIGIGLALVAIPMLSYQPPENGSYGHLWIFLALFVFLAWGIQAFFMKLANQSMSAESIFFYMAISSIALLPIPILMTDFDQPINWGWDGPLLAGGIQVMNSIGALSLVYAFRYGKAIIVSPLTNAGGPVITIILSLIIYAVFPHWIILIGMILAVVAIFLMAE
ncbi:DMT family transporter [Flexithrix dorotheae]|uniref:DMT family transporter n=1 Tax=Flexithrix dorotheae TaxID=70993 RepID=UPI000363DC7F|nr:EamA family transporter [Flexithrix dorotheae]